MWGAKTTNPVRPRKPSLRSTEARAEVISRIPVKGTDETYTVTLFLNGAIYKTYSGCTDWRTEDGEIAFTLPNGKENLSTLSYLIEED